MKIKCEAKDRCMQVQLTGELDHHAAREVMQTLDRMLYSDVPLQVVLDFSGVTFMDSSGIAVVMRAYKRMRDVGGRLLVSQVPPQAKRVLLAANLQNFVNIN